MIHIHIYGDVGDSLWVLEICLYDNVLKYMNLSKCQNVKIYKFVNMPICQYIMISKYNNLIAYQYDNMRVVRPDPHINKNLL